MTTPLTPDQPRARRTRKEPRRRTTRFGRWVESYGVGRLAAGLGATRGAIYHWLAGRWAPRPEAVRAIRVISKGEIQPQHIYRHREVVARSNKGGR